MAFDYFQSGISGYSSTSIDLTKQDFPKQKYSFVTPGKKVESHIWNLFSFSKSYENKTLSFITGINNNTVLTPSEHVNMANETINLISEQISRYPKSSQQSQILNTALDILSKAKEDIDYLTINRNVLLAG
jgi:hypothetical protein